VKLASAHIAIFDKLMDAYTRITEMIPQLDRLESVFKDDPRFQMVSALVYTDILEFHGRAYKFFRRRGESIFEGLYISPNNIGNSVAKVL
jgi:hypothetical protein